MKSKARLNNIVAVAFAAFLILCSGAQASNLLGFGADLAPRTAVERPAGLFDQVASWLMNAWTDLKVALAQDTTTTPTIQGTCDAGWGLDPEGCPTH
jgi:hypothetical protein